MKMFVFKEALQVSDNYHDGGGLMVVASDTTHAKELIEREPYVQVDENDWERVTVYDLLSDYEPTLVTFPDAGCC